jgi:putative addiction module killer protein
MANFEITYYRKANGISPFRKWYEQLDNLTARKIYVAMLRIEAGNFSDSKYLKSGIWERRIHWGPGYRLYYGVEKRRFVVMLAGGAKKTQHSDINIAVRYWNEFKSTRK